MEIQSLPSLVPFIISQNQNLLVKIKKNLSLLRLNLALHKMDIKTKILKKSVQLSNYKLSVRFVNIL